MIRCARHDLHQSLRTSERYRSWIESRLLIALGGQQAPVPTDIAAICHEIMVVMRDDATFGIKHRREHTSTYLLGGEQCRLFLSHLFDQ